MNPFTDYIEEQQLDKMIQQEKENRELKKALQDILDQPKYWDSKGWALNPEHVYAIANKALAENASHDSDRKV